MTNKLLPVLAVSALALSAAACSNAPTTAEPGVYKSTTKATGPNGTTTKTEKTTSVYEDAYGDKKATVKTETTNDPKGLFNKTKTTTVKTYN